MSASPARKFILLLAALGVLSVLSVGWLMFRRSAPSLVGGSRLVYAMDAERALQEGRIGEAELEDSASLLQQTVEILEHRVNPPRGILGGPGTGARVRPIDGRHIAVEIPAAPEGTDEGDWAATTRQLVEAMGEFELFIVAGPAVPLPGTDLTVERAKLDDWIARHPGRSIHDYNRLATTADGPAGGLCWLPRRVMDKNGEMVASEAADDLVPLIRQSGSAHFSGEDLVSVGRSQDSYGYPAVQLEIRADRQDEFTDMTESNVNRAMAFTMDGVIYTLATIKGPLPGKFIIEGDAGGFSNDEVTAIVRRLRAGQLQVPVTFESLEALTEANLEKR